MVDSKITYLYSNTLLPHCIQSTTDLTVSNMLPNLLPNTMNTIRTHKKKRAVTGQPQQRQAKQRKQLSTEIRPLRSNAALRARLQSEEEAAARPL